MDAETALHRSDVLMEQQYEIMQDKMRDLIGTVQTCVVEEYDHYTDSYSGRTWMDAPEIDSMIHIISARPLELGSFADVEITDVSDYDFIGEAVF